MNDAQIRICVLANEELYGKISNIRADVPSLEHVFSFENVENCTSWTAIAIEGTEQNETEVHARMAVVKNEDLATIIYTSGTTGNPKGVMLSHQNILSNVEACKGTIPADQNSKVLSFLPVCHIYERMLHYLYMYIGCSIHFAESMETIGDNIREVKPDVFTAVPRLIEKVFDKIMAKGDDLSGIKRVLFFWAVRVGEEYDVIGKSFWYKIKLAIARKLIFMDGIVQSATGGLCFAILARLAMGCIASQVS
jgi:long-chain acyl-CoA synthetase